MKKVAFIVQRCGKEINGGAELLCRQMAQRMSKNWQTEILTTCALDYMTWENYYPMGIEEDDGTIIRRFSVDAPRNINVFNSYSEKIFSNLEMATLEEQEYWMSLQGPISTPLFDYIKHNRDYYDTFIFFTYLYATTYFLLPIVREKAWLVPAAHHEWPIYMSMWNDFFGKPQGFIFNSFEERDFLKKRFQKAKLEGPVAGIGIEPPKNINPERFRDNFGLKDPFLLYVGRIDESKGCRELFDYFIELKRYIIMYPINWTEK